MSGASDEADSGPRSQVALRERSRVALDGSSFAFLVSGVVILIAVIFYDQSFLTATSPRCQSFGATTACLREFTSRGPFGSGLGGPPFAAGIASPWVTTYWVVSIFLASCAVVAFYWSHSRTVSKRAAIWPFATLAIEAVVLVSVGRGFVINELPGDVIIRGLQALLLVALGLVAIAIIARSWALSVFVAGFLGLALLSCLYNVSNLFQRIGLGSSTASSENLPNLLLPAVYLLVGAGGFSLLRRLKNSRGQETQESNLN
jgi:hypothetical protein